MLPPDRIATPTEPTHPRPLLMVLSTWLYRASTEWAQHAQPRRSWQLPGHLLKHSLQTRQVWEPANEGLYCRTDAELMRDRCRVQTRLIQPRCLRYRYWQPLGPQQSLYLPGVWLHEGDNQVLLLELEDPPSSTPLLLSLDAPDFSGAEIPPSAAVV